MFSNYYKVLHNTIALLACETLAEAMTLRIQGMGIELTIFKDFFFQLSLNTCPLPKLIYIDSSKWHYQTGLHKMSFQ